MEAKITENEPAEAYHSDKNWFGRSQLWDLYSKGPAIFHARHITGKGKQQFTSASMEWGSMIHEWAEVGPTWVERMVTIPSSVLGKDGRRIKETAAWEEEQRKARPEAVFLKADEIDAFLAQISVIRNHPIFQELTEETTHREISVRWRDEVTNLPLKCRPDAIAGPTVWDIKTTKEQMPLDDFWKSVIDYGYDFQVEHYLAGCRAAGIPAERFVFLVTSIVPPYSCHAITLPERLLVKARNRLRATLNEVRDRIELDHWEPADHGTVTELYVPERFMEKGNDGKSNSRWVQ